MLRRSRARTFSNYDDLLLYWVQMMSDSALAEEVGGRFDHVLVDEYQDTNRLQSSILFGLKPRGQGLTVVGDDAQAIISFRAATVRNILDFPNQFSPPANMITLDRQLPARHKTSLPRPIGVIGLAAERLYEEPLDGSGVRRQAAIGQRPRRGPTRRGTFVELVLENREAGTLLKQQAVLFRTSSHSGPLRSS